MVLHLQGLVPGWVRIPSILPQPCLPPRLACVLISETCQMAAWLSVRTGAQCRSLDAWSRVRRRVLEAAPAGSNGGGRGIVLLLAFLEPAGRENIAEAP